MFYSQCLLSGKGPLGAIWVAAYFFKKLKKAQVTETDISSSVDKILQDELNVVTYRVLAYLLLGVVRIYSKKVEYLFDDCHEVLTEIKNFVVSTKDNTQVETMRAPCFSITLPERFELDAFDLDILDDVIGGNVVSKEEITLKDNAWTNEGMRLFSLDKYQYKGIAIIDSTYRTDFTLADNILFSSAMDIDVEVSTSPNLHSLEAQTENFQHERFSQVEGTDLETFGEEAADHSKPSGDDHQTQGEQINIPAMAQSEDNIHGELSTGMHEDSRLSQEGCASPSKEPEDPVNQCSECHQSDGGQTKNLESGHSENEMCQVNTETGSTCNLETSMEKHQVEKSSQVDCMDLDVLCGAKEEPPTLVRQCNAERRHDSEASKIPNLTSSGRKFQINGQECPLSIRLDGTPPSKFPDASGLTTPEFIPTPAARERARERSRIPRKRKCLIDETLVLRNSVLRQRIHDASDLVSKRRKTPRNSLAAWKASRISSLPGGFFEPLMPCFSSDLRSLFYIDKGKILESAQTMCKPKKLDMPEASAVCESEQIAESAEAMHKPRKLDMPQSSSVSESEQIAESAVCESEKIAEYPILETLEQIAIAPETPVKHPASIRSVESPDNGGNPNSEEVRRGISFGRAEQEPCSSPCTDQEFDICLLDEEMHSCGAENAELCGWSGRTKIAVRYLQKNFLNRKKGGSEAVLRLSRVLEGRTKKESARLFYEILVLGTTGYVDVRQENGGSDIKVWKLPKWDQTFEADFYETPC